MVNPKCIEKEAPTVKEKAELEQENGRDVKLELWVVLLIQSILPIW